jgi:hypothetical protein
MRVLKKKTLKNAKRSLGPVLRYKKTTTVFLVLIIVTVVMLKIAHSLSAPSYGEVQAAVVEKPKSQTVKAADTQNFIDNDYLSISYPGRDQIMTNAPKSPGLIDYWFLHAPMQTGSGSTTVGLSLKTMAEGGGIEDESAYRNYLARPDTYKISHATFGTNAATVATTISGNEKIAFVAHGGSVLITDIYLKIGSADKMAGDLAAILTSLEWK